MDNYTPILQELEKQEKELQFSEFTNETALAIGLYLIERAKNRNKNITIDITRNEHQLFHYSFPGTSQENDRWVIRKNRVVNKFHKSSLYMENKLKSENTTLEETHGLPFSEYAPSGGAFPLIIKNEGVVGTVTVSGLTGEEDHEFATAGIRANLK
jgi:uncharacterized protein (UPF0303 family)